MRSARRSSSGKVSTQLLDQSSLPLAEASGANEENATTAAPEKEQINFHLRRTLAQKHLPRISRDSRRHLVVITCNKKHKQFLRQSRRFDKQNRKVFKSTCRRSCSSPSHISKRFLTVSEKSLEVSFEHPKLLGTNLLNSRDVVLGQMLQQCYNCHQGTKDLVHACMEHHNEYSAAKKYV